MNSNKDCETRREAIAALVLGELESKAADDLKEHIATCETCRSFYEALTDEEEVIRSAFATIADRGESIGDNIVEGVGKELGRPSRRTIRFRLRTIMESRITKLAAAAVIIIAVFFVLHFAGGPDMASVAWGEVTARADQVDFVHFYELKFRQNRVNSSLEGWFSKGQLLAKKDDGTTFLDDGKTETVLDKLGQQIRKGASEVGSIKGMKFFEKITQGLMQYEDENLLRQVPSHVGDDFLIYRFGAPKRMEKWVQSISITVGMNSLLPVQMKIRRKDQEHAYDLYIFDYEEPEKPAEFFGPQSVSKPPHGKAEVVLDGKEVTIDISDSPGIKAVAVRLYRKHFENVGELNVFDAAVITTEGFRRGILQQIPWELNKESQFSMGTSEHWPDKKFRYIEAKIVIRPTEKENVYLVEVSCWLDR